MNADDKKLIDLLERWQSGNFSLREEQELQRLLQTDDTFAKDAAEGFLQYPEEDHTARLNRLHQKLRNSDRDTNPFFTTRIFSLAAALAFLSGPRRTG